MTVRSTGKRTFFHNRGANRMLEDDDLDPGNSKIFHLRICSCSTGSTRWPRAFFSGSAPPG
jgi:sugar/nucleoside kinase (ribokinase family)